MTAPATIISTEVEIDPLVASLIQAIGTERVMTAEGDRRFYSQDVFRSGIPPLAVVRPGNVEEVQRCVALCAAAGAAIVPRGGGMSYTDGYLPTRARSVAFDLQALDRIVSLNVADRVVTVEAGCTWRALEQALAPHGLRTPYWGPFSGRNATVGGAMSQNSAFWGAVRAGSAARNVLGLEIVLADASLIGVGALGGRADAPAFWRDHGPDLTGLFTGDCGALGLKVRVTLPLERRPPSRGVIAFAFDDPYAVLRALSEMAREQLISEACFFDKGQQDARVTDAHVPLKQMIATARSVAKEAGLGAAVGMAFAGKRYLANVPCSLNLIVEGSCAADLKRRLAAIRAIAKAERARPLNAMIARVLTADHFPTAETTLADHRFLPVHAIVPHSRAGAVYRGVNELFAAHADECKRLAITTGVFSIAVGAGAILIEPTWHWTGAFLESHPRLFEVSSQRLGDHAPNPEAEAFVGQMRERMMALFLEAGAAHFQLGKVYPFRRSRGAANLALLDDLKRRLDPDGLMNPGPRWAGRNRVANARSRRDYADGPHGQVHFLDTGEGAPVVLLHQAPLGAHQFDAVFAPLAARGLRAIAIDLPGFGQSDPPDVVPAIADYAGAVPAVLDRLGLASADLLGHHTGALVATEVALAYPDRVRRLILNGPMPLEEAERAGFLRDVEEREKGFKPVPDGTHLADAFRGARRLRRRQRPARARAGLYPLDGRQFRPLLVRPQRRLHLRSCAAHARGRHPTLILTNTGDAIYDHALRSHALRPDWAFVAIEGGGIDIQDQAPGAWASAVAAFLMDDPRTR